MGGYKEVANKYGFWIVVAFIKEDECSNDRFIDFRAWLLAQSKETYLGALESTDSLIRIFLGNTGGIVYPRLEFSTYTFLE